MPMPVSERREPKSFIVISFVAAPPPTLEVLMCGAAGDGRASAVLSRSVATLFFPKNGGRGLIIPELFGEGAYAHVVVLVCPAKNEPYLYSYRAAVQSGRLTFVSDPGKLCGFKQLDTP